jgi:hypothetical protein
MLVRESCIHGTTAPSARIITFKVAAESSSLEEHSGLFAWQCPRLIHGILIGNLSWYICAFQYLRPLN